MRLFQSINNSATGLTAQRLRMDTISDNLANVNTTRARRMADGTWAPYRRKMVVFEQRKNNFSSLLEDQMGNNSQGGVKVSQIVEDREPFKMVYNPSHPDANAQGYVLMPNVNTVTEMVDMISATRAYEANVTAVNSSKSMFLKALEIGRG